MPPILALECPWDDGQMTSPIVFRLWTGVAVTVLVGAVVVLSLVGLAAAGDVESLRRFGPAFVALEVVTAALFWWPAVIVGDDAVKIRNPFRTTVVPWEAIDAMETRVGLRLVLRPNGSVSAWAAPPPARRSSATVLRYSLATASKRANDALQREARGRVDGQAGTLIRRELARRERLAHGAGPTAAVIRRPNFTAIVIVAVTVVAAILFTLT